MIVWVQVPSPAYAEVAELADAHGSGPCGSNTMRVQVPPPALAKKPVSKTCFQKGAGFFVFWTEWTFIQKRPLRIRSEQKRDLLEADEFTRTCTGKKNKKKKRKKLDILKKMCKIIRAE